MSQRHFKSLRSAAPTHLGRGLAGRQLQAAFADGRSAASWDRAMVLAMMLGGLPRCEVLGLQLTTFLASRSVDAADGTPRQFTRWLTAHTDVTDELGTRLSGGCQRQHDLDAMFTWGFAPVGTTVVVL